MPFPRRRARALLAAALSVVLVAALAGCGDSGDDAGAGSGDGAVKVVATTTVLGDVVREVGGDAVDVTQLLQPNSDPHDYEPRPDDVLATAKAKVVFASGDGLDGWIDDVVKQSGGDAALVDVAARLPVQRDGGDDAHDHAEEGAADESHAEEGHAEDDPGATDPHWWHDPTNVETAAAVVRDELTKANPGGRATYAANAARLVAQVRALDASIRRCLDGVPVAQRKLVTDHDALGYFADRYDVEIVGAVIPSLSTQAQPSAGDLADLAKVIRREGARAVFPESGSSRKLPDAVAQETGATAEYQLYGDSLGPADSAAGTYVGMEAHNADAMVRGFTGGARGCTIER
ncbi:metal ABC transporter substrate-binding protein [Conexibacter woesei]|uniref:Periplasmic solute binding protein n=1 Tax=Conexibacter woesei (strain DSM 14684 / CCUG 47730 / CIP 108061 / JCM 11494 / NBRC 100937 / ID131577) TaxID=469383 RepID=D3EZY4_CONWI|nr:metal ABC transporter substrate-binding protein [Conexibacter woesei]ADB49960.1 periplasmic solute binding protein [Conexibacter woesei DSM 14684]